MTITDEDRRTLEKYNNPLGNSSSEVKIGIVI